MLFAHYGQAVLLTHERCSRVLLTTRQPNKASRPVVQRLLRQFAALPPRLRQTLTLDNGTEFALHHRFNRALGLATYFGDPHAPWQKGGLEKTIGRVRRRLPRKTELATPTPTHLAALTAAYPSTPRPYLGFRTPTEVFCEHLARLHFKRESTPPPSRG